MFDTLIHFLTDKIIRNKDKDKYLSFARDLYTHGGINDIKNDYVYGDKSKINMSKEKDDYGR